LIQDGKICVICCGLKTVKNLIKVRKCKIYNE
jgi:hypothetical protein